MYCVIQEVELKKKNVYGSYKELKVYTTEHIINNIKTTWYRYCYGGEKFERPIRKAYKVSIHKSYREDGKVKKKQWVIGTMDYYSIATNCYWIGDCIPSSSLYDPYTFFFLSSTSCITQYIFISPIFL